MWKEFLVISSTYSIYPFSPLITHITYDGGGSEQVDPLQTLYKRSKSHSLEVSSTIHNFPSLCFREKTDLTVGGSLTRLHQLPLIVLSFLFRTRKLSHSPKHSSLLIFVHHHIVYYIIKVGLTSCGCAK